MTDETRALREALQQKTAELIRVQDREREGIDVFDNLLARERDRVRRLETALNAAAPPPGPETIPIDVAWTALERLYVELARLGFDIGRLPPAERFLIEAIGLWRAG